MGNIADRLRASVRMDAVNGDKFERSVCARQMIEAADTIDMLSRSLADAQTALKDHATNTQDAPHA